MKNITVFIGSLRKDSLNRKAFEKYQMLGANHFQFHEIPTADFPHYNADIATEIEPHIAKHIEMIKKSDGLLFFSPEYNYSVPGHLKNAIDWISRSNAMPFDNKKAAIIGVSPGMIGTARMQYELRKIGVFLNIHFMHKPEVMIGQAGNKFNDANELVDQDTIEFLEKHVTAFNNFI